MNNILRVLLFVGVIITAEFAAAGNAGERVFEGELLYRSCEYHSPSVIKYSYGQAYNGVRNMSVVVKGNNIHITDLTMHIHYAVNGDKNTIWCYSDITNEAVELSSGHFNMMYGLFGPQSAAYNTKLMLGEEVEFKGDKCRKAELKLSSKFQTKVEASVHAYYSELFDVPAGLRHQFYGTQYPGIVKKWCMAIGSPKTMLGGFTSIVSSELVALEEYRVSDSEFELPEDMKVLKKDTKNYTKILKNTAKIIKKENAGLFKQEGTWRTIADEWDFISDWEVRAAENAKLQSQYANFGSEMLSKTFSLANQIITDVQASSNSGQSVDDEDESRSKSGGKRSTASKRSGNCTSCHGTGICTYCNGDGYNYSAGTPYRCNACKTNAGVCERCHGHK